ncbi:MAG: alpha-galactosidase, partial [Clostridia bacterium]|nr:alpha-galactosidase [Clostridia bacterium]
RSCSTEFPYYRLCSHERAIAIAVSWQGQWETSFEFDWLNGVKFSTKLQYFDAYLKPGEKIRTALVALVFSEDADEERCINLWRNWMVYDNTPRTKEGKLLPPWCSIGTNARFYEAKHATEENQLFFINTYAKNNIPFDFWWIDAMWYDCGTERLPNWCPVGTWDADPVRFPNTLKPISDRLHEINAQLLTWFEPERVSPGTYIYEERPEFTLTTPAAESEEIQKGAMGTDTNASIDNSRLLNLADDGVTDWLIDKINHTIDVNGIDLYRQDMNTNPLRVWQQNDEPNRVGMLENKYCVNLFRYWDALVEAHPGMIIDTCASGGRRIELETVRRSIALCKSDYNSAGPLITCGFHHSLYQWLPYFGSLGLTEQKPHTDYIFAANFAGWIAMDYDVRTEGVNYDGIRRFIKLHKQLAHVLHGNYYALLPYSRDPREWSAWQFHCPEKDEGVALVVAHPECLFTAATLPLREIDPTATYEVRRVKDLELGEGVEMSGAELAAWKVSFTSFPEACIISYKKK